MLSVIEDLKLRGVAEDDIVYLNLDKRGFTKIKTPEALEAAIEQRIKDDKFKYIFIDEVQNVKGFEEVINAYREDGSFSIFITGIKDEYRYIQVAMTIMDEQTENREYAPFTKIRDNYPKYLLTIDTLLQKRDGVIHKNIIDFIANDENL